MLTLEPETELTPDTRERNWQYLAFINDPTNSVDPSGIDNAENLYRAFKNDPINFTDPNGLSPVPSTQPASPMPVWTLGIPTNLKDVTDLGTATQFKNEAYNRSVYYRDYKPVPIPGSGVMNTPFGTVVFQPDDYKALHQQWWNTFKAWEAREKELSDANTLLKNWLLKHKDARYGMRPPTNGATMSDPNALPPPSMNPKVFSISRPWGVAALNVASAGIIGKGGPGSKSLDDVDPSSGYTQPERARPGTPRERIDPNVVKNGTVDARANAAESGLEVAGAALQEGFNGLKKVDVVTWEVGSISGYYVKGQPNNVAISVIRAWTGLDDLYKRGEWK